MVNGHLTTIAVLKAPLPDSMAVLVPIIVKALSFCWCVQAAKSPVLAMSPASFSCLCAKSFKRGSRIVRATPLHPGLVESRKLTSFVIFRQKVTEVSSEFGWLMMAWNMEPHRSHTCWAKWKRHQHWNAINTYIHLKWSYPYINMFEIAQPISWFSTNHGIQSLFCFHFQVPTTPVKQQAGEDENIRFQLRYSKFKCI